MFKATQDSERAFRVATAALVIGTVLLISGLSMAIEADELQVEEAPSMASSCPQLRDSLPVGKPLDESDWYSSVMDEALGQALTLEYSTVESNHANASFGHSVASAGDVNGDGIDDIIVGAPGYENGESWEGCAYLYLGSFSGLLESPSWTAEGNQENALFGNSVASAGDVNNDGFDDVVVGAPGYGDGGRVYLYLGSADGLETEEAWTAESDQANAKFGDSVASAGDVNNDGFDDIVVGADRYDNGEENEGRAYLYLGSADGLETDETWTAESGQASAEFGCSVSSAGDVNEDGFDDVIVGAWFYSGGEVKQGCAYLYLGSADGLETEETWTALGEAGYDLFGNSVSSAGDVNNDGFDDVVVGAPYFSNGEAGEGRAYLYFGCADGLETEEAWTAESDQAAARFGYSVSSAGDVNRDGFHDVLVGALYFDNGETREGRAYLYLGSSDGLAAEEVWTGESDQQDAYFGTSVSCAGDVNGDGIGDIIVGAPSYDNGESNEGRAYLYLGSVDGLETEETWVAFGEVGYDLFGWSVSSAGDVNGDGFDDVIVGACGYGNGEVDEGRAYLYLGSADGLETEESWTAESDQANAEFGWSVACAGDVNNDGYDDVIVGAHTYDNGEENEGRAYLYLGSADGLETEAEWVAESDQEYARFGRSVASAGDVNGDGFDDVIIGAYIYSGGEYCEGRAYLFLGSADGLETEEAWTGESDQDEAHYGHSVASAGDVNGDGFDDVVVGACMFDGGEIDEGRVYLYLGSADGLETEEAWTAESDQTNSEFGWSVAYAGDVNNDGFDDVVVGAYCYDDGEAQVGRAYLYLGSADGLETEEVWAAESDQDGANYGRSVACAGDVNGDGFDDVMVGAPRWDTSAIDAGRAYLYLGDGRYRVTFDQDGLNTDAQGVVLSIGNQQMTSEDLPCTFWVCSGIIVNYNFETAVGSTVSGREYSLIEVTGPSSPVTVASDTTVVGRYDSSPTADAGPDQTVDEDLPVTFDGSGSSDDIGIVNYIWTFTDGVEKTLYGAIPSYTFHEPGMYNVTLNVSDASDHHDTDTVTITVIDVNEPPTADAGPGQNVTEGDEVTFDGSSSSDDVGIENYTWTFTYDGEAMELYGVAPTFTFDIAGTYVVTLTVEDAEGETDMDTVTIIVEEEEQEEEDEKSFIESYGLPIGIVVALAVIALILFFVLKGRKGGSIPDTAEDVQAGEAREGTPVGDEPPPPQI